MTAPTTDLVQKVMAYEEGEMPPEEILPFFGELVRTHMAWSLQGFYGRTASNLISGGYLSPEGEVLMDLDFEGDA